MALFGTKRKRQRPLTAAGARITRDDRAMLQNLQRKRQDWQGYAWGYRDAIGEIRGGIQMLAWAVSKVRWVAAQVNPDTDDLTLLPGAEAKDLDVSPKLAKAAQEELGRLPLNSGYSFAGVIGENFKVAGECWLHGFEDPLTRAEKWMIRSVDEIKPGGDGQLQLTEVPGATPRQLRLGTREDPGDEEVIRLWVPHPRWSQLPDSPMKALLDPAEDLLLASRELRSVSRSRVATNGILKVPDGLTLYRGDKTVTSDNADAFIEELTAALIAPLTDEGSAGSAAPAIVIGSPDDLAALDHLRLDREDSLKIVEKYQAALMRVLRGLDIPPEQVTGLSDVNHWGAWVVDVNTFKQFIEPLVRIIADSLTEGYLWPALIAMGFAREEVVKIRVGWDAGKLTENPNRTKDANEAYGLGLIKGATARDAYGFGEEDAPDEEELRRMVAFKAGVPADSAALVLGLQAMLRGQQGPVTIRGDVERDAPQTLPGDTPPQTPDAATPNTQPPALVAAITDPAHGWTVHEELADELANITLQLHERVQVALEGALERGLERAGNRVRTAAHNVNQREKRDVYALTGKNGPEVAAMVGADGVATLNLNERELFKDAFDGVAEKIRGWTRDAADAAAEVTLRVLGHQETPGAVERVSERISGMQARAWQKLRSRLVDVALDRLYRPGRQEDAGENITSYGLPGHVRDYIGDTVQGDPARGLSGADAIRDEMGSQGAIFVGEQWRYGLTPPSRRFHPHHAMDRRLFSSLEDRRLAPPPEHTWLGARMHPGDHVGCFVAGTVVSGARPVAGFERAYVGEGVKIRTDRGDDLTGTPNHPVLTPRGWVPLGKLQEGDQLVVASREQRALAVDQEYQQVPALIDDVATTLPMAQGVLTTPMPSAAEDFHGDGTDGQVTVVRTDSRLLADLEAAGAKLGSDDVLKFARERTGSLASGSVLQPLGLTEGTSTGGGIGDSGDALPVLFGGARVEEPLGLGVASDRNPHVSQPSGDGEAGDLEPSGESLRSFAGEVALAKIAQVDVVDLDCHVYNLQTLTGWYVANGIIVSNCDCYWTAVWATPGPEARTGSSAAALRTLRGKYS